MNIGPIARYLLEIIQRYNLEAHAPDARRAVQLYRLGLLSESMAKSFLGRLQLRIKDAERRPNYLHRPPTNEELYPHGPPDIVIGRLAENPDVPLGLFLTDACHCLLAGTNKAGKTVGIRRLINSFEEYNRTAAKPISLIVLDYKGGDFADLPARYGTRWRHFDAHGALRLGLQNPPGVPPNIWVSQLVSSFCTRAGLISSAVTLANLIRWLVRVMNPQECERLLFPDFQLILDVLRKLPPKAFAEKLPYVESLKQMLEGATQASGNLLRTFGGLDLERDLIEPGLSAVLSMRNLSPPWLARFLVDLLVLQVLVGRVQRGHKVDRVECVLVIDEADNDVTFENDELFRTAMPPLTRCLREGRELGLAVVLGVAALRPVSQHISNSMAHQFVFRMVHADCIETARRALLLPANSHSILGALEPGECVARLPGSWSHAVLAKIDYIPPCRDAQPKYDEHPYVPAKRLHELPEVMKAVEELGRRIAPPKPDTAVEEHAKLEATTRELLFLASLHPYWPVARLMDVMETRPSPPLRKVILDQLRNSNLATVKDVRSGSKTQALLELRESGWSLLGKPVVKTRGRGELPHRTFSTWVAMVGEKLGHTVELEWLVPPARTHPVDVAWKIGTAWHVFEVSTTALSNLGEHLTAIFAPGSPVQKATIVAAQKEQLKRLRRQLDPAWHDAIAEGRIDFQEIAFFEKEIWP
jgi:hypothetical protein